MIRDRGAALRNIDFWMGKSKDITLRQFRSIVWAVFKKIVLTTPQWSGKAAANWNIGVGAPDHTVDDSLGEQGGVKTFATGSKFTALQAGNPKWVEVALARNRPRLALIRFDTPVFISNGVRGDDDHGKSSETYLYSLQDPAYWTQKLRIANMPYETVSEILASGSWRELLGPTSTIRDREGLFG